MRITITLSDEEKTRIDKFFLDIYGYSLRERIVSDIEGLLDKAREQISQREAANAR